MSDRPTLWHGSHDGVRSTGGVTDYAWFVWQTGAAPQTTVGWLRRPANLQLSLNSLGYAIDRLNRQMDESDGE
jgi:hypothetical protein